MKTQFISLFESVAQSVERSIDAFCKGRGAERLFFDTMAKMMEATHLQDEDGKILLASVCIAFKEQIAENADEKWMVLCGLCRRIRDCGMAYDDSSIDDWQFLMGQLRQAAKCHAAAFVAEYVRSVVRFSDFLPSCSLSENEALRIVVPHSFGEDRVVRFVRFDKLSVRQKPFVLRCLEVAVDPQNNSMDYVRGRVCEGTQMSLTISKEGFDSLVAAWNSQGIEVTVVF